MKKKRSAKQLINDKRLGRMAKARAELARKKNPKRTTGPRAQKRRKVAKRKKNTLRARQTAMQRATNPHRKEHYVIATLASNNLKFHDGVSFNGNRANAAGYSLPIAKRIANRGNKRAVIAPSRTTSNALKKALQGKA